MDAVVGITSGDVFLSPDDVSQRFNALSNSQQDLFRNLAGRSIPIPSGNSFLSGERLSDNPINVYGLTQWQPSRVSSLFGSLVTPGQPKGYFFLQDLGLLNEYYPRYTGNPSPLNDTVQTIKEVSGTYTRDMFASYGNTYFNALERGQQQDQRDSLIRTISAAVIGLAAAFAGMFMGPVEAGTSATAGATGATSQAGTVTVDPVYFSFDTPLYGASEFSFEPIVLTGNQAALLTGAPAIQTSGLLSSSRLDSTLTQTVQGAVVTKPIMEVVQLLANAAGKVGQGILNLLSGNFQAAARNFGIINSPSTNFAQTQGGSGGGGFSPSQTPTSSSTNFLPFALAGGMVLLIVFLLRKK